MTKYIKFALLCSVLWLQLAIAQTAETADEPPEWLAQVAALQRQEPEAMLKLLLQHKDDVASLSVHQQANWYFQQASLLDGLGRHQEQQQAAQQGLSILGDEQSVLKVKLLYTLGFALEMQANYPLALQYYQQGIALATLLENDKQTLMGQINHAAVLSAQNQQQQALALLKDTYQRAPAVNDTELLAEVNAELGLLYASMAYEQEAIDLLSTALQLYEQLGWQKEQIAVLFNLARTYSYLEQYSLSLETYNMMLQKSLQVQDNVNLYHAYLGLAITSSESGSGDAALSYIAKAEHYLPLLQSTLHISTHHYEKAKIYLNLKQASMAMQQVILAERGLTDEGVEADSPTRLNVWYLKAQLLAELGEYERAYRQLDDFVYAFEDVRNKENELAVEHLRIGFEHERQVQQNRLLEQDNELKTLRLQQAERQRQVQLLWLAILSCSTLVLLVLLLWQLTRQKHKLRVTTSDTPGQTG
ncbi:hypothetical protein [Rheinheimera baltica]|uniref:hypothetical protein n=1 Tax=Rheinheimera baltica TaxID=67576 RepID=UPI00273F24C8|nr:hypothetical protein [Rheinheimera baltica]MDP5150482.1 hypothetical protein [Rheinheimera baltica]